MPVLINEYLPFVICVRWNLEDLLLNQSKLYEK